MNITVKAKSSSILKVFVVSIITISLLYTTRLFLDDNQFAFISIPSYIIIPGALAVTSIYIAIKEWKNNTENKVAILFFAVGSVSWFVAEQTWQILDVVFNQDPFPSLADVFYLFGYPFFVMFLILYLKPIKKNITKPIILFSAIISLVFLIPSLHVLIDYYQEEPTLNIFIGFLYPILSSILLFFSLLGITFFVRGVQTYFWMFVFMGFLIDTVADTLFLFTVLDDSYYDGQITDLLYLVGYICYITGIIFYFKTKTKVAIFETYTGTFEIISKFAIPLIIGTVFFITSVSLLYTHFYRQEFSNESLYIMIFVGMFVMIAVFSTIIFMIVKNVNRFLNNKTKEIEKQKRDLEIMIEKKSEEIAQSSEFSNIGTNLSQIIHDIKNPITVLKINIDIIENGGFDNPVLENRIKNMKQSIGIIEEQIDDILNYVKKPTVNIVDSDILEILEKSINSIDVPKTVSIHIPTKNTKITCDPVRMTLVFINLFTNAIDAMDKKGTINVKIKQSKNKITIDFENSGPEIPQEIMGKIFDPLFTTKEQGTGLGLPTCKKIIQQHGGSIGVKNDPTTFSIELPQ
ncbi:MAG TPA: ATP-binding protein [Nitrosarchaeum sp.]|jgi:signal transduction histidine kinase|nr:ATP-binding protein [Nitrosarchaeum sp.]